MLKFLDGNNKSIFKKIENISTERKKLQEKKMMSLKNIKKVMITLKTNQLLMASSIQLNSKPKYSALQHCQSSLNANCVMRRLCFGSKYISATVDKLRISLLLFLMLLVKASFGTQKKSLDS